MGLSLPPKDLIRCDAETARYVHHKLTSVIAGHPKARTTYQFYEEIDRWLGPWGDEGYPIGYGKFYNIAFRENEKLQANESGRRWFWKTTILLQKALRDFIVRRIRNNSLPISKQQLNRFAFDSHPRAYHGAGLTDVILTAPELIPVGYFLQYCWSMHSD